ncbi:unnamed protein product, partial [Rotaria magnacalcarata]
FPACSCMNSGVCNWNQLSNTYTCTCANYVYGSRCENLNQCFTSTPCNNGATCVPGPDNTFTCQCPNSYSGRFCEQSMLSGGIICDQLVQIIA